METDEPPQQQQPSSHAAELTGQSGTSASVPQQIHYHFHDSTSSPPNMTLRAEPSVHSGPSYEIVDELDDSVLGIGAATSSQVPSHHVLIRGEPYLDNRMERLMTSRTSLSRRIQNDDLTFVSFPYFDPSKLKPIEFNLPVPGGNIVLLNASSPSSSASASSAEPEHVPSRQLQLLPLSHGRRHMRLARKRVLFRIGLRSQFTEEKKLMTAAQHGEVAKVSSLIHDDVNPNCCDHKRRTPLHVASSRGHYTIVHLLLAMGADPKMRDILGNTPLHLAVCRGDRQVVKLLIENGANIHIKDNNGRTPLSIVKARLNTLREDKSISTDRLKGEFLLMADFLQHHEKQMQAETAPVEDLCRLMEGVSTREQADEIADAMINKMSTLCIENQTRQTPICHPIL